MPLLLPAALKLGELHASQGRWPAAARRRPRAADVATAFRRFGDVAVLLEKVADAQERLGHFDEAASSRRAASPAAEIARRNQTR